MKTELHSNWDLVPFLHLHGLVICGLFFLTRPLSLSSFSIRTSQPRRTRAPGTASRPWPPSCPSCLGSRRTGWSCTIRTGTPPPLTHPTRPRETSRLKCEDTQTYTHSPEHTHAHAGYRRTQSYWTSEKLYISPWFSAHTHCSPSPAMCSVGSHTVLVYRCSGQTWKEDCSTLYFHKDYWKERTGAWHVCDWRKIFKWTSKTVKNLFLRKMSWFYSGEKKEHLFQLFDHLGGKKEKEEYFCTVQFFL